MLSKVKGNWSIVVIGQWNVSIFSPPWLSENIFDSTELQIEFPVVPGWPLRITCNDVQLVPSTDRLVLNPTDLNVANLKRMESFAIKVLQTLKHTPVSAVGANFGFKSEPEDLEEFCSCHFPTKDDTYFTDNNFTPKEKQFTRSLTYDRWLLNLKTTIKESTINFDLNYHAKAKDTGAAATLLNESIVVLRDKSEEILNQVYGLTGDMQ